jgi:Fungal specific transcription factor domain
MESLEPPEQTLSSFGDAMMDDELFSMAMNDQVLDLQDSWENLLNQDDAPFFLHHESSPEEDNQSVSRIGRTQSPPHSRRVRAASVTSVASDTTTSPLHLVRSKIQNSKISVPNSLVHTPTLLIENYFERTCSIFSSFDSSLNPFRSEIGKLWQSSPSIYYAMQSMTAAYLADDIIPAMSTIGLQMQKDAFACLQEELKFSTITGTVKDETLVAVLLLGLTAGWHDTQDLGLVHLSAARLMIRSKLREKPTLESQNGTPIRFYTDALIYWEMLSAFVTDEPDMCIDDLKRISSPGSVTSDGDSTSSGNSVQMIMPHPWTGVAPEHQILFAETGKLIRRERLRVHKHGFTTGSSMKHQAILAKANAATAHSLEEKLLAVRTPTADEVIDTGDTKTPVAHHIAMAESYRCAALLQLYRVFPDLIARRLGHMDDEVSNGLPSLSRDSEDAVTDISTANSWLTSLAIHILQQLEQVPRTSGTRCVQPLILLISAGELRFSNSAGLNLTAQTMEVAHARKFVLDRLRAFLRTLPAKPIVRMIEMLKETWLRLDDGRDAFWMDIMIEKGWETIMG